MLPKLMGEHKVRLSDYEEFGIMRMPLETSFIMPGWVVPYLYMAGFISIAECDKEVGYKLKAPNTETRNAMGRLDEM